MRGKTYWIILIGLLAATLLNACAPPKAAPTQAPTGPLPVTAPPLPFSDNPDPSLCEIPQPDGRQATVTGDYGGELVQPIVYLYDSHSHNNVVVGGQPVSVTFCPLRNASIAFDRNFDDQVFDFGTTGNLRNSDLIMYDRQTETWWQQFTTSNISEGRDIGSVGVFDRRLGDRVLVFTANGDGTFEDEETGTAWNLLGEAIEGPLAGEQLQPLLAFDHFWFAWAAFNPDTELYSLD